MPPPSPSRINGELILRWVLRILVLSFVIFLALTGVGAGLPICRPRARIRRKSVTPQSYLLSSYIPLSFVDKVWGRARGLAAAGPAGRACHHSVPWIRLNLCYMLSLGTICATTYSTCTFQFYGPKGEGAVPDLGPRPGFVFDGGNPHRSRWQRDVNPDRWEFTGLGGRLRGAGGGRSKSRGPGAGVDRLIGTLDAMFDFAKRMPARGTRVGFFT